MIWRQNLWLSNYINTFVLISEPLHHFPPAKHLRLNCFSIITLFCCYSQNCQCSWSPCVFSISCYDSHQRLNEVWTKELWERFTKPISRRSDFAERKCKEEIFNATKAPENEMFGRLTFDEGGRHRVYPLLQKKIKTEHCFVFMHNKLLCARFFLGGQTVVVSLCIITDHLQFSSSANNDAIFSIKFLHKGRNSLPFSDLKALLSNCALFKQHS